MSLGIAKCLLGAKYYYLKIVDLKFVVTGYSRIDPYGEITLQMLET